MAHLWAVATFRLVLSSTTPQPPKKGLDEICTALVHRVYTDGSARGTSNFSINPAFCMERLRRRRVCWPAGAAVRYLLTRSRRLTRMLYRFSASTGRCRPAGYKGCAGLLTVQLQVVLDNTYLISNTARIRAGPRLLTHTSYL